MKKSLFILALLFSGMSLQANTSTEADSKSRLTAIKNHLTEWGCGYCSIAFLSAAAYFGWKSYALGQQEATLFNQAVSAGQAAELYKRLDLLRNPIIKKVTSFVSTEPGNFARGGYTVREDHYINWLQFYKHEVPEPASSQLLELHRSSDAYFNYALFASLAGCFFGIAQLKLMNDSKEHNKQPLDANKKTDDNLIETYSLIDSQQTSK